MAAIAELRVDSLPLTRGGRQLQSELSFGVSAGQVLSVRGPNGAGKTSLLRAIAGLLDAPDGCICFRMLPEGVIASAEERIGKIGWFGHQDGVKRQLSVVENLRFFAQYNLTSTPVEGALAALGLLHLRDLPAQFLSHGQRRRLAFARLLVARRSLWLLDEPMTSMDEESRACIRRQVQGHCQNGGIVVATSHESLGLEDASVVLK